jgi:hypothetical protein
LPKATWRWGESGYFKEGTEGPWLGPKSKSLPCPEGEYKQREWKRKKKIFFFKKSQITSES